MTLAFLSPSVFSSINCIFFLNLNFPSPPPPTFRYFDTISLFLPYRLVQVHKHITDNTDTIVWLPVQNVPWGKFRSAI